MTATTYSLSFKTVTEPDLGGFRFYVEAGKLFDADDYASAYNLNRSDIDAQDIHSAQDAAGRLNPGEWLEVTHETKTADGLEVGDRVESGQGDDHDTGAIERLDGATAFVSWDSGVKTPASVRNLSAI